MRNEKKKLVYICFWFEFLNKMLNFEAVHETISSGVNLLFLKNESFEDNQNREI